MKTWGAIQNEVLGLMFSNANGGEKITLSDASAKEYVINMADAFNYGIRDLLSAKPYLKKYSVRVGKTDSEGYDLVIDSASGKQITIDFANVSDFSAFGSKGIYFVSDDGSISKVSNHFFMGDTELVLNISGEGLYTIYYEAYPESVSEETKTEFEIKLSDDLLDAVVYYMASRLYAEDDIQLSTHYLNIYSDKKAQISAKEQSRQTIGGEKFVSERGWI